MKTKLTLQHIRDYALPQRRINAERYIEKSESNPFMGDRSYCVAYWQGYLAAVKSVEQLIKDRRTDA